MDLITLALAKRSADHALVADNAEKINNKRLIGMTQDQYDVAVLDPDTFYLVTPSDDEEEELCPFI